MNRIEDLNKILIAFDIGASCTAYKKIRNIACYDIVLELGTRVKEIAKSLDEMALALKAQSKPIMKLLPNQGIVQIEVAEENSQCIGFFDEFVKLPHQDGALPIYLGNATNGNDVVFDFGKSMHTLIGGSTGSGKSAILHSIIANALSYDDVNLFLIDPKSVEFKSYQNRFNNIHTAISFTDAVELLKSIYYEMSNRYKIAAQKSYPSNFFLSDQKEFSKIILIIDEFADLIMQDENKIVYNLICKLSQKCRAAGIFCVLATQHPSAKIISSEIKSNFPSRIACQTASGSDAKVIMDMRGAENLIGAGDAIIRNYKYHYQRFQAAYTTPEEVVQKYGKN